MRKVPRSLFEGRGHGRHIGQSDAGRASPRQRKMPPPVRALEAHPPPRPAEAGGPNGAPDEFLLAATVQNLRKLAKLVPQPTPAERAENPAAERPRSPQQWLRTGPTAPRRRVFQTELTPSRPSRIPQTCSASARIGVSVVRMRKRGATGARRVGRGDNSPSGDDAQPAAQSALSVGTWPHGAVTPQRAQGERLSQAAIHKIKVNFG